MITVYFLLICEKSFKQTFPVHKKNTIIRPKKKTEFLKKIESGLSKLRWDITDQNVKFYGHYVLQAII